MPTQWPQKRRFLGTKVQRLDASLKATGRAKYTFDINRPGMLYGQILRSPHAHAKVKAIDTAAARSAPGVKALVLVGVAKDYTVGEVDAAGNKLVVTFKVRN